VAGNSTEADNTSIPVRRRRLLERSIREPGAILRTETFNDSILYSFRSSPRSPSVLLLSRSRLSSTLDLPTSGFLRLVALRSLVSFTWVSIAFGIHSIY
jgi:hypothetical protein